MKKILVTTLALSLAAVSMVDAKEPSKTEMAHEKLVNLVDQMIEATKNKKYKVLSVSYSSIYLQKLFLKTRQHISYASSSFNAL